MASACISDLLLPSGVVSQVRKEAMALSVTGNFGKLLVEERGLGTGGSAFGSLFCSAASFLRELMDEHPRL